LPDPEPLCARCARHRTTCCQTSEIYVTPGDVERIAVRVGRDDFYLDEAPANADYLDQGDDPAWREYVFGPDGRRRVLRREPGGNCIFLGPHGCTLPLEVRPLVCRLYPYLYNESGFLEGLDARCPVELLLPGEGLIEALGMSLEQARPWHHQLYREIRLERRLLCTSG